MRRAAVIALLLAVCGVVLLSISISMSDSSNSSASGANAGNTVMASFYVYGRVQNVMFRQTVIRAALNRGMKAGATNTKSRKDEVITSSRHTDTAIILIITINYYYYFY